MRIKYTRTSGGADCSSPHIVTMGGSFESQGRHTTTLLAGDLTRDSRGQPNFDVAGVVPAGKGLSDGAEYEIVLLFQDLCPKIGS